MLSREWRCSRSSADRGCSNYIRVINNFYTPFFKWDVLWYGLVRPSVRSSVCLTVSTQKHRCYWRIIFKFGTQACLGVPSINYASAFRRRRHYVFGLSVRPSVRPSEAWNTLFWPVHRSVGPPDQPLPFYGMSVRPSIRPSVRPSGEVSGHLPEIAWRD